MTKKESQVKENPPIVAEQPDAPMKQWLEDFIVPKAQRTNKDGPIQPEVGMFVTFRDELFPNRETTLKHQESAQQKRAHIYFIYKVVNGDIYAVPIQIRRDGRTLMPHMAGDIFLNQKLAKANDHQTATPDWYIKSEVDIPELRDIRFNRKALDDLVTKANSYVQATGVLFQAPRRRKSI